MNGYLGDSPVSIFKLELDAEKLSQNYKIKPFAESYTEIGSGQSRTRKKFEEFEEQIQTNEIKNVDKYVNKLIIIKDKIERMKDWGWFDSDGGRFKNGRISIPEFFREYLPKVKFQIYIQEGSTIKKDDEWIESIKNYQLKQIYHGYALAYKDQKRVKDEGKKYEYYLDDIKFIDKRNKIVITKENNLTLGYVYENLHLKKDKNKLVNENILDEKETMLRLFDFKYKIEDIISTNGDDVYVKKGKLVNLRPLKWFKKKTKILVTDFLI